MDPDSLDKILNDPKALDKAIARQKGEVRSQEEELARHKITVKTLGICSLASLATYGIEVLLEQIGNHRTDAVLNGVRPGFLYFSIISGIAYLTTMYTGAAYRRSISNLKQLVKLLEQYREELRKSANLYN